MISRTDEENKDDEDSQEEVQAKLDEPTMEQDSAEEDDSKSDAQTTKHEEPLEKKSEENIRSSEEQPEREEKNRKVDPVIPRRMILRKKLRTARKTPRKT